MPQIPMAATKSSAAPGVGMGTDSPETVDAMSESGLGGWNVAGVAGEDTFERLLYNRHSRILVAQFRRTSASGVPIASLYARSHDVASYTRLFEQVDNLSYEDPVVASSAPVLISNIIAWDREGRGNWHGIVGVDLEKRSALPMLRPGELSVVAPYTAAEVTHVHCSWSDGSGLVCTIALSRPATDHDQAFAKIDGKFIMIDEHWLCDLSLVRRTYTKLTALANSFF